MKRAHRRAHAILWLMLTPAIAAILWFAITDRPDAPVNETLPPILTGETG
ncbi:MAG: hypothetical protein AAGK23_05320 [Pseudomonadota bacterium]